MTKKIELVCDDCGKIGGDVEEGFCPYNAEVNDCDVPVTLCADCYKSRLEDI